MPLKAALAGQFEILTREVARDDVPIDEEALDDLGSWDAMRIYTSLIRTTQIANKSMASGGGGRQLQLLYALNRIQTLF